MMAESSVKEKKVPWSNLWLLHSSVSGLGLLVKVMIFVACPRVPGFLQDISTANLLLFVYVMKRDHLSENSRIKALLY